MTTTVTQHRADRVAEAQALRAEGLLVREIAEHMGVAVSTAGAYLADADLSKQAARRARYAALCEFCGNPTDGSGGFKKQRRACSECITWPREAIIDAIRRWAEEHGGIPPTLGDWRHSGVDHPCGAAIGRRFNWNELLLEAGYALRCDRRPETIARIISQAQSGWSLKEIADAHGSSVSNIYQILKRRGVNT